MKIGLLTTYLALGDDTDSGIGQHFRVLADALAAAGHDVHVFYLCQEKNAADARGALATLAPRWTCDLVVAPMPGWLVRLCRRSWPAHLLCSHLLLARAGRKAVLARQRTHPLEIIETHSYNLPPFFLLGAAGCPLLLTRVSTTLGQMNAISLVTSRIVGWEAALERRVIHRSAALVTHTRQHRDAVCELEREEPARFAIVPHGLPDPGEPAPAHDRGGVEFLFVGRFEARKGIDVLLAAIPEVLRAHPEARFTLAGSTGDGQAWAHFLAAHPDLVSAGSVQSLGRVSADALTALYRRCTVLVAPSRYESFGLIYTEAMSHAKPVIGCTAGGVPEVVTAGVTGLLAAPGDVPSLVDCLLRLAGDPGLRERMGRAGRADFLARFSAGSLARNSVALYRDVLARPAHA